MNSYIVALTLLITILFSSIELSKSECCHVPLKCPVDGKTVETCYDCTEATIYCGKGQCNIFGCNCDGGCRAGDSSLWCWNIASKCYGKFYYQQLSSINEIKTQANNEFFINIDTDCDGRISFNEARNYLIKYGPKNINIKNEFEKLDTNRDGFLAFNEIDCY